MDATLSTTAELMGSLKPATLAEAIRRHGDVYARDQSPSPDARRLMAVLLLCRTAALGGHLHRCADCAHEQPRYNTRGN